MWNERKKKKRNFYIALIRFTSIKTMDNLWKINSIYVEISKKVDVSKRRLDCTFRVMRNLILEQKRLYVGNRLIQAALGWSMGRLPMYRRFYYNAMIIPVRVILNTCLIETFYAEYLTLRYKKNCCIENQE